MRNIRKNNAKRRYTKSKMLCRTISKLRKEKKEPTKNIKSKERERDSNTIGKYKQQMVRILYGSTRGG